MSGRSIAGYEKGVLSCLGIDLPCMNPAQTPKNLDRRPVVGEHTLGDQDGRDGENTHKGVNAGDDFGGSRFLHIVGLVADQ